MALKPSQFASDITAADMRELCKNRVAEDVFIEFKQTLFRFPGKPPELVAKLTEDQIEDTLADIVSFANAFGGHLIVGIEENAHRAQRLTPLPQDEAVKIAQIIRDRAAVFVKPRIVLLEAVPFPIGRARRTGW